MNKTLIIAGSVIAVGVIIYFVWKSSKKATAPATGTQANNSPMAGGIFAPKTLTEDDFKKLEQVFVSGNPYNAEIAVAIEGQGIDENFPTRENGSAKNLLSKQAFDNLVLAKIRRLIGERSGWIQEEENRRFLEWSGAARAGYNDSLARAWAYVIRINTAIDNYYTSTASGASQTGSGTTNTDYNSRVEQTLRTLTWGPTNINYILTAMQAGATGQRIYFDTNQYKLISATEARTKGVTI